MNFRKVDVVGLETRMSNKQLFFVRVCFFWMCFGVSLLVCYCSCAINRQ